MLDKQVHLNIHQICVKDFIFIIFKVMCFWMDMDRCPYDTGEVRTTIAGGYEQPNVGSRT